MIKKYSLITTVSAGKGSDPIDIKFMEKDGKTRILHKDCSTMYPAGDIMSHGQNRKACCKLCDFLINTNLCAYVKKRGEKYLLLERQLDRWGQGDVKELIKWASFTPLTNLTTEAEMQKTILEKKE